MLSMNMDSELKKMKMNWKNRQTGWKRQQGMTLMELLVAGFISIIASGAMVVLMANTLSTGTKTIKMTQLSEEMRAAMQIMTRELRRANYHSTYVTCFGDTDCLVTEGINAKVSEININAAEDCFWFWYDRPQRCASPPCTAAEYAAAQTLISQVGTKDTIAAFRLTTAPDPDGTVIGTIQMTTTGIDAGACPTAGWVDITNANVVDIQSFEVLDDVPNFASYTFSSTSTQSVERIGITMSGRLKENDASLPGFMQAVNAPELVIQDFVRVRNDVARP